MTTRYYNPKSSAFVKASFSYDVAVADAFLAGRELHKYLCRLAAPGKKIQIDLIDFQEVSAYVRRNSKEYCLKWIKICFYQLANLGLLEIIHKFNHREYEILVTHNPNDNDIHTNSSQQSKNSKVHHSISATLPLRGQKLKEFIGQRSILGSFQETNTSSNESPIKSLKSLKNILSQNVKNTFEVFKNEGKLNQLSTLESLSDNPKSAWIPPATSSVSSNSSRAFSSEFKSWYKKAVALGKLPNTPISYLPIVNGEPHIRVIQPPGFSPPYQLVVWYKVRDLLLNNQFLQ